MKQFFSLEPDGFLYEVIPSRTSYPDKGGRLITYPPIKFDSLKEAQEFINTNHLPGINDVMGVDVVVIESPFKKVKK